MMAKSPLATADTMTKRQRLLSAVRGEAVDRPPVSAWMHFGSEHLPPRAVALLHRKFYETYSWDFIKVMADYRFGVPDHMAFETRAQLQELRPPGPKAACFKKQIECLKWLQDSVGPEVPLFDSGYDPYQMLLRHIGRDQADNLWRHADLALAFLEELSDAIVTHVAALKSVGVEGYFHSTNAGAPVSASRGMADEVAERFVRPFNLKILDAAQGLVRILHAHGSGIELRRLCNYQFEILHLSDRDKTNPGLSQARRWSGRCVMGGIDEAGFSSVSIQELARQVDDAVAQTQGRGFILSPGCVVPPSSSARSLHFIRQYLAQAARRSRPEPAHD